LNDALRISFITVETNLPVGFKMIASTYSELQVLYNGKLRIPGNTYPLERFVGGGTLGGDIHRSFEPLEFKFKAGTKLRPGDSISVKFNITYFETDTPPQHFWTPTEGRYKVLYSRRLGGGITYK